MNKIFLLFLCASFSLSTAYADIDAKLIKNFPLRVPQSYINKMRHGDVNDPLLRQVFPLIDESIEAEQERRGTL